MPDFKTELMEGRTEDELHPRIAKVLMISAEELARHPYKREDDQILWSDTVPDGVPAKSRVTTLPPSWI